MWEHFDFILALFLRHVDEVVPSMFVIKLIKCPYWYNEISIYFHQLHMYLYCREIAAGLL